MPINKKHSEAVANGLPLSPYQGSSQRTLPQHLLCVEMLNGMFWKDQRITSLDDPSRKPVSFARFVAWFFAVREHRRWSDRTWRKYRCAFEQWMNERLRNGTGKDHEFWMTSLINEFHYERMDEHEMGAKNRRSNSQGNAGRWKFFDRADANEIIDILTHENRSTYGEHLSHWIRAGLYTGLRPIEWRATQYKTDRSEEGVLKHFLIVSNFTSMNARGSRVVRVLDVTNLPENLQESIKHMSRIGYRMHMEGSWDTFYRQCSQLLTRTCRTRWGRKNLYTLYSCRHQFIANMKATYDPVTVAVLAGYGIHEVARKYYARSNRPWPEHFPVPVIQKAAYEQAIKISQLYHEELHHMRNPTIRREERIARSGISGIWV